MILKSFLCFNEPNLIIGMEHHHDVYPRCFRETIEIIARSFGSGDSRSREEKKEFILYIYIYISSLKYKENIEDLGTKYAFHPWKLSSSISFAIEDLIEDRSIKRIETILCA